MIHLDSIQRDLAGWQEENFDPVDPKIRILQLSLGVSEETGELAHSILKSSQGIRKDQNHEDAAKDAVGDICIYLMQLCTAKGWSFEDVIKETANHVMRRTRADQMVRLEDQDAE